MVESLSRPGARIQVLRGPRQVGKSTALHQVVQELLEARARPNDILLIRFDLDILREVGGLLRILRWYEHEILARPLGQGAPFHLLLDEIHKLPRWDEQVKHVFDTYRPKMILTGSSSVLVARGQRESLAGRALTTEVPPFLFREVLELTQPETATRLPDPLRLRDVFEMGTRVADVFDGISRQPPQRLLSWKRALDRYYNRGGYPDLHTKAVDEDRWADYLTETVFDRVLGVDIPDLFPVDQPRLLRHLYMEVARRTGQEIAQKRLADEATAAGFTTNQPTVGRYLHYLADALLIREFRRFPLVRKASAKVPIKCTLTDLGVRNAIFRGAPSLWESTPDIVGPLVETLVQTVLRGVGFQTHFYRAPLKTRREGFEEIDFACEAVDGNLVPIEVKFRRRIDAADFATIQRFVDTHHCPLGIVVTRETYEYRPLARLLFVPLLEFLLAF